MEFKNNIYMKILSLFLICISTIVFGQTNCRYSVKINNDHLKDTGYFTLSVTNTGSGSFKIPKKTDLCNIRLIELELFNNKTQTYEKMSLANKDIDCFKPDKMKNLKSNKTFKYKVNIKSDFEVLENVNFFEEHNNLKYRFKISFPLNKYKNCENLITDWIYKN